MHTATHISAARFVPQSEFEQALDCLARATAQATDLVDTATSQITECEDALDTGIGEFIQLVETATATALEAEIDRQALEVEAAEAVKTMRAHAANNARLEQLTPSIETLVRTCLERIIGQMDASELTTHVVSHAVAEMQDAQGLKLRVEVGDVANVEAIAAAHPTAFAAISEVVSDPDMAPGHIHLVGDANTTDISIATQLDTLMAELRPAIYAAELDG